MSVLLGWPLLRDALVLVMVRRTRVTTETLERVRQTELFATIPVFGVVGALSFMLPRPFGWRLKLVGLFFCINLLCCSQMEYPHIGDASPVLATLQNELAPFLGGFLLLLLACGNESRGAGPAWPRAWTGEARIEPASAEPSSREE